MVPLAAFSHYAPGNTPLAVNHQGTFVATTISFNLAPNVSLSHATAAISDAVNEIDMPPTIHGSFAGHGAHLRAVAEQRADADPHRARHRLHRAGHSVRELHPPDHHPLDAAVGRRRRGAGAATVRPGVQHHRADRRDPADRHRQEERHHDDRLRARGAARPRQPARGGDLQRLAAALPPDHDDHHGGDARRAAARLRHGRRRRDAPAARHLDRRRTDREPGADALHHAGDVSVSGSLRPLVQPCVVAPVPGRPARTARGPDAPAQV